MYIFELLLTKLFNPFFRWQCIFYLIIAVMSRIFFNAIISRQHSGDKVNLTNNKEHKVLCVKYS